MCADKPPKYAALAEGLANCELDRIIERKGPYTKFWVRSIVFAQEYITKRDISHIQEERAVVIKTKDGVPYRLFVIDGKPKWRKMTISKMFTR